MPEGARCCRPSAACTLQASAAISSGTAAGRKSSGTMTSRPRTAEATAATRAPSAASPISPAISASTSVPRRGHRGVRRQEEVRQRDGHDLHEHQQGADGERLRGPDRRARDRREQERVEQALVALGVEDPRDREQRGQQEGDPERADRHRDRAAPAMSAP